MLPSFIDTSYTRAFFRDRLFFILWCIGALIHIALWLLLFLGFDTTTTSDREYITLHYKVLFGTDFVATWYALFLVPITGLVIAGLNYFLALTVYHIERRASIALLGTSILIQMILVGALYLLLQINLY